MPRRPGLAAAPLVAVSMVAVSLVLAACTTTTSGIAKAAGTPSGTSAPSGKYGGMDAKDAAVLWTNDFCNVIVTLRWNYGGQLPPLNGLSLEHARGALSDYLTPLAKGLDDAIAGVKGLERPQVPGGDQLVSDTSGALDTVRQAVQESQTLVAGVRDVDAMGPVSGQVWSKLKPMNQLLPKISTELRSTPELQQAVAGGPSCQEIEQRADEPFVSVPS